MRASIISVGTELTNGQILNKNAQWLAEKLDLLGIITDFQISTPDQKENILSALRLCEDSDLLFITGGLGPTTDDFTREVVAEWAAHKLIFDEKSWQRIHDILTPRRIPIREMQRQQCYFPEGSTILVNSAGTANGYKFKRGKQIVFVLPGPPKEIESIWKSEIETDMEKITASLDPWVTYSWNTMGLGESEIAFKTEEALKNITIEKSYRVHLPYVEVKVSFHRSKAAQYKTAVDAVDLALLPWTISKNKEDLNKNLNLFLQNYDSIYVQDDLTQNFFFSRFEENLKFLLKLDKKILFASNPVTSNFSASLNDYLILKVIEKNSKAYLCIEQNKDSVKRITEVHLVTPYDSFYFEKGQEITRDRRLRYLAELVLIETHRFLLQQTKETI